MTQEKTRRRAQRIVGTRARTATRPAYKPGRAHLRLFQAHCLALWPLFGLIGIIVPAYLLPKATPGIWAIGIPINAAFMMLALPGLLFRRRTLHNIAALDRTGERLEEIAAYRQVLRLTKNGKPANEAARRQKVARDEFICRELGLLDVRGQMPLDWRVTRRFESVAGIVAMVLLVWFAFAAETGSSLLIPGATLIASVGAVVAHGMVRARLAGKIQDRLEFEAARSPLVSGWAAALKSGVHQGVPKAPASAAVAQKQKDTA